MLTPHNSEVIDQDRRRILGSAAMGMAVAGTISLFHAGMALAEVGSGIRPFRVEFPEHSLLDLRRRINATDGLTARRFPISHKASTGKAPAADALLGDEVRLAEDRGKDECASAVRDRDRRNRHSFHSCPLEHPNALPLLSLTAFGRKSSGCSHAAK